MSQADIERLERKAYAEEEHAARMDESARMFGDKEFREAASAARKRAETCRRLAAVYRDDAQEQEAFDAWWENGRCLDPEVRKVDWLLEFARKVAQRGWWAKKLEDKRGG